jgi:hypothetical protein
MTPQRHFFSGTHAFGWLFVTGAHPLVVPKRGNETAANNVEAF